MSEPFQLKAYGAATRMLGPLTPLWIRRRTRRGKEDPARIDERFGIAGLSRPDGPLIWCHGASVGECTMLLPLIHHILAERPNAHILMTSGTVTSADLMAERLPDRAFHQYVPLDYPKAVERFLAHWQPDLAIWAESEIWPNLIRLTRKSGANMALINARMSEKSLSNWNKKGVKSARSLFSNFDRILAADERTAKGLSWLLDRDIDMAGNLKDAAPALPADPNEVKALLNRTKNRPVWCAASTHPGEDELMIAAHQTLLKNHPKALMVLAPRHPERADEVKALLREAGLSFVTRTSGERLLAKHPVFLVDTIGDMGLALRISDITVVCGSLVEGLAGHNPLEPARLGNAVITGPYISSFAPTYMNMISFDAAQRVLAPEPIGDMITDMFDDPKKLKAFQKAAQNYADSRDALLDYVWEQLEPLMPEAGS